ncbi:hypothetical protein PROFUN_15887, partial [Planoprotostelium fungivorum]
LGTLIYEMLTGLPPFYSQNINYMYQKIMQGELRFPSFISNEAQILLEGLLTRDVDKRLGSGPNGGDDVKKSAFFSGLDWAALERKEIEPPFKPKVKDVMDYSQIDTCFTQDKQLESAPNESAMGAAGKDVNFDGFTFVSDSAMDTNKDDIIKNLMEGQDALEDMVRQLQGRVLELENRG